MTRSGVGDLVAVPFVPLVLVSAMCLSNSARRSCRPSIVAEDMFLEVVE